MAKKFIVKKEDMIFNDDNKKHVKIIGKEVKHIQVLRHNIGDNIIVNNYICKICKISKSEILVEIQDTAKEKGVPKIKLNLFLGVLKGDKMDFVIQKATELGASNITPFISQNVVVKLDEKGINKKQEKYKKIVDEACKQCGRTDEVNIQNIINFKNIGGYIADEDITFLAYENENNKLYDTIEALKNNEYIKYLDKDKKININIIIGAEGGFNESEIEELLLKNSKINCISLGERILRAETAVINLISIIMYEFDR